MLFPPNSSLFVSIVGLFTLSALPLAAQEPGGEEAPLTEAEQQAAYDEFLNGFAWQKGGEANLGNLATVELADDLQFLDGDDGLLLLQSFGNLIDQAPEGIVGPESMDWFLVFTFDDSGYVSDEEQDELDADALLDELKAIHSAVALRVRIEHINGLERLTRDFIRVGDSIK